MSSQTYPQKHRSGKGVKCDYCDDPAAMQITRTICGVKYEWHTCPTHRTSFDLRSTTAKPSEVVVTYLGWAS